MNEKFYELKKEKQDLMINGAMELFAKNGYKRASTDEMVRVSGVSKGLWFHYFENKKGLYDFIVGYGIKYAIMEYENMHTDGMNIYELIKCFERTKIILMDKYPFLPLLIVSVLEEQDEEANSLVMDVKEAYNDCLNALVGRVVLPSLEDSDDLSRFGYIIDTTFRRILKECYQEPVFRREFYLSKCYEYLDMIERIAH